MRKYNVSLLAEGRKLTIFRAYKGSKIDWDSDECAAPLEQPQNASRKDEPLPIAKSTTMMNRFQLLNMDVSDDNSLDDEHDKDIIAFKTGISSTVDALAA